MRKLLLLAFLVLAFAVDAAASACYVSQPSPPNKVTTGGFFFVYPIRFIGTGAAPGDVPGGTQDTTVEVTYLTSDTAVQKRDKLFTAITAAAGVLGIPAPARAACAGFYDLAVGTL